MIKKLITMIFFSSLMANAHESVFDVDEKEISTLLEQGGYQEVINLLPKVLPSLRSSEWQASAKASFTEVLKQNLASGNFNGNLEQGNVIKTKFPLLLNDVELMEKVLQSGLVVHPSCRSRFDNQCMSIFGYSLAFNTQGPNQAARLFEDNKNQIASEQIELIQFYEIASRTQRDDICTDPKLQNTIIIAASRTEVIYQKAAINIVVKSCSKFKFPILEDNLHRDDKIQNLMCAPMSKSGQLGKISSMVCKERDLI
ncbi:hypothetical protein [Shewanella sp. TB7-MNA-CIBAN-0143]|jgi:hypothetical protein|uniref:hypothetical protein n=1 Tax=unclassified Shewanella TaxID=196818 RepID=UPI003320B4F5